MMLVAEHGGAARTVLEIENAKAPPRSRSLKRTTTVRRGLPTTTAMRTRGACPKHDPEQKKGPPTDHHSLFPDGSYFLTIGINEPGKKSGLPPLAGAISDAMLVRNTLQHAGFTCLGELCNPTACCIRQTLGNIKAKLRSRPKSRFILFLAGHGINIEGEGWVCTAGMDKHNLEGSCLEMNALKDFAKRLDCRSQLFLLDCCHAASLISCRRGGAQGSTPTKNKTSLSAAAAQRLAALPAVFALCAAPSDSHAFEVAGTGLLTKHFCNGIRFLRGCTQSARNEEFGSGAHTTAAELFNYILRGVLSESEDVGCLQLPCFAPILLMHKTQPVEGQFLLF